jgi:putative transposase
MAAHGVESAQYLAMSYTQRLAEAELVPSVGSVGDSYDSTLAETINGLNKAEVIWRQRSWPNASAVEMATLRWVDQMKPPPENPGRFTARLPSG